MSFMKGDLLTKTRKLVKGMAKAEPVWLKAMEQAPPATFPRSDGKVQKITLPEDVYVKKFFQKHPDSLYHDAIKSLKSAGANRGWTLLFRRWAHISSLPPPLDAVISPPIQYSPFVLPELDQNPDTTNNSNHIFGGSLELMAVPKKKISRHKRGIRNGPKALKPVPVIVHCKSCGRVKLPHFFCCSGERREQ